MVYSLVHALPVILRSLILTGLAAFIVAATLKAIRRRW